MLFSNDEGDAVNKLQGDDQKEGDPGSPMKQSRDAMIEAGAGGVFHFGEVEVRREACASYSISSSMLGGSSCGLHHHHLYMLWLLFSVFFPR